jgi:hypothetical protein
MATPLRQSPDVFLLCFQYMRSNQEQIKLNLHKPQIACFGLTKHEAHRAKFPPLARIGLFQAIRRR